MNRRERRAKAAQASKRTARSVTKAWRPCCGACRMPSLTQPAPDADIVCIDCGAKWDGSELTPEGRLPAVLEEHIAAGFVTREQAYASFLLMDELAEAAAKREITVEQGAELVEQDAMKITGKGRAS